MATILYKDGKAHRVDAIHVPAMLMNGFTAEKEPKKKRGRKTKAESYADMLTGDTGVTDDGSEE